MFKLYTEPPAAEQWLSEISDSTTHGMAHSDGWHATFMPWESAWSSRRSFESPMFGSVYMLPATIWEYVAAHRNAKGMHSMAGWNQGRPGIVPVDIDREHNLDAALADTRAIVGRLLSAGVGVDSFRLFFSGSKGFSIHLRAEAFGPGLAAALATPKKQAHENAVLCALKAVCGEVQFDTTIPQTIRLFRLPNSRHQKTRLYKIPLTIDELMKLDMSAIQALATSPRMELPIQPSTHLDTALARLLEPELAKHLHLARALEVAKPRRDRATDTPPLSL
jgi:hypothetical protein